MLLEDVSAEMLTVYDAKRTSVHPGQGTSCAVSYRRIQPLVGRRQQLESGLTDAAVVSAGNLSADTVAVDAADECMLEDASGVPVQLSTPKPATPAGVTPVDVTPAGVT